MARSYIVICPNCKKERSLNYKAYWYVAKHPKTTCMSCRKLNLEGLSLGRAWNKGKKGYNEGHKPYFLAYGANNPAWKGGITPINAKIRNSNKYALWRLSVFERDDYTCQDCGQRGGELQADHIKPFAHFPELRLSVNNGRTLCVNCHKNTDTYLWRAYQHGI